MSLYPKNLLIVDDHYVVVQGIINVLKIDFYNCEFSYALNGEDALEKLKNSIFDLIILDVSMPKMDGFNFLKCLKQLDYEPKIIILTQFLGEAMILYFLKMGVNGVLFKGDNLDLSDIIKKSWNEGKYFGPELSKLIEMI